MNIDLLLLLTLALGALAARPGQPNRGAWLWRLTALLTLTPGLRYVGAVFGFAARLTLSHWAGEILRGMSMTVKTEGNVLIMNGQEMAVDPACLGLRMTGMTLLVAIFWLLAYERKRQRALPLAWVLAYAGLALGLTLLANLLRIMLLVVFALRPDQLMHEGVGLLCVAVYAWLPLWAVARLLMARKGQPWQPTLVDKLFTVSRIGKMMPALLLVAMACVAFVRPVRLPYTVTPREGYTQRSTRFGFVQYSRPGELIYVKPLPNWYSTEHSPAICWQGRGYTLRRVREVSLSGQPIYVGELKKGHQTLQTAWWFSNGYHHSIGQFDVRSRMLRGEPGFALINVTTTDARLLPALVQAWK
ncbi:exosortase N [Fibrella aquatilis]|uniref:Exosortase N n=1 Tax=Fibrella aquatilis TaxID=2817059 RepID=A0A939G6M2_9BACT|nr:exosortase N [Fibrella aquatilis]MBO0932173.1 exosortase N [Fibrella aquatilis]